MEIVRLNAGNDRNGNPRRVYVVISDGQVIRAYDEGYTGHSVVPEELKDKARDCATFPTTAAEYRSLLKVHGKP